MNARCLSIVLLVGFGVSCGAQNDRPDAPGADTVPPANTITGRTLFLRNCAHCHGADAHGNEGPDLHDLGRRNDWIANRIRQGKAGEMTAFAGKLQPAEIAALVLYVQSLK